VKGKLLSSKQAIPFGGMGVAQKKKFYCLCASFFEDENILISI
jgi:hypothetical protein